MFQRLSLGGLEGDRTLEPHGCEPCALPAELQARFLRKLCHYTTNFENVKKNIASQRKMMYYVSRGF